MKKVLIVIVLILISCNSNKKEKVQEEFKNPSKETNKIQGDSNFTLILSAKLSLDHKLSLYYEENPNDKFNEKNRLFKKVQGTDVFQDIEFKIKDPKIFPSRLRLHFSNRNEKQVIIKSIELKYKGDSFLVKDSTFSKYFSPNKFIKYGLNLGEFNFQVKDNAFSPYFVSRPLLTGEMDLYL
ncbi:hypothetical protein [uncultured Algibacter sp.]|uniref:hypothetical protein n=1 Tax=uncultured Algibacter sp. TaxID=298659 RepID=UPI002621ED65|nr:hypothetical protein [uncultured Algibacter sp.]